jgi:hypothetical protein
LILVVAAAAGGATAALWLSGGTETETVTTAITVTTTETVTATETVTEGDSPLIPAAVERTRAAVQAAAQEGDYDALAELIPAGFRFSFGDPGGSAVDYWRGLAAQGDDPLPILARILELPYTLVSGTYFWPFAYDRTPDELTDYERGLLGDLTESYVGESYYGWRAGIAADGTWQFFVRGD